MVLVVALTLALLGPQTSAGAVEQPPKEWIIGPHKRVAIITFDGASGARKVDNVLSLLRRRRAPASFFFPGRWVANHKSIARRVRRRGHVLGNGGWRLTPLTDLGDHGVRSSIRGATRALRKVGAHPRPFLRMPEGKRDLRTLRIAGSMGYGGVRWTQRGGSGLARTVKRRVLKNTQPGMIISLDLHKVSNRKALGGIIRGLRRRSFELKTINALRRAHPVRWDITLRSGSHSKQVRYLDKRLGQLTYPVRRRNSSFDYPSLEAVYAFEKVHRMTRDGVVPPSEMRKIATARRPEVRKRVKRNFIEIDISRQVLFEVKKRKVRHTLPISSGNEEYYQYQGSTYKAHTPRGRFSIVRKISGWRTSFLGRLWYPSYFVGGFAIHGSTSVPTYPASHGCVRIPMYATKRFYNRSPIGRPVFVHR